MESRFDDEFGASTGDKRENDPSLPGFTEEDDRLFRSHFQHANRFADRSYQDARPAYAFGYAASGDPRHAGKGFDEVEKDLENGWMNERFPGDEWQTVRASPIRSLAASIRQRRTAPSSRKVPGRDSTSPPRSLSHSEVKWRRMLMTWTP